MKKIISGLEYFWHYLIYDYFGEGTEEDTEEEVVPNAIRVTFGNKARENIKKLMDRCEIRTILDLIRKSFSLLDMLSDHIQNGGKVILEDRDGTQRVLDIMSVSVPDEDDM